MLSKNNMKRATYWGIVIVAAILAMTTLGILVVISPTFVAVLAAVGAALYWYSEQ